MQKSAKARVEMGPRRHPTSQQPPLFLAPHLQGWGRGTDPWASQLTGLEEARWGQRGEMNQALYAHINNKRKMKKKKEEARGFFLWGGLPRVQHTDTQ
jgi:hypothetical protein